MNTGFEEALLHRRSIRKYSGEQIPGDKLRLIVNAGLLSPTSRNRKPWEFIIVENKNTLAELSKSRAHGASMLEQAAAAIVVLGDSEKSDVWTEDCSIAMSNMHLMADSLGVGSCWIQGRLREAADGRTAEEYVRELLGVPEKYRLEAILSLGMPAEAPEAHSREEIPEEKLHREKF